MSETTVSLCDSCLRECPAALKIEAGWVWMDTRCPVHGVRRSLLSRDADEFLRLRAYVPPRATEAGGCCGGGGCAEGPPVCVSLLEITDACNLRCPTCYADARGHTFLGMDEIRKRFDGFFAVQNKLDVLMLSGGEPTLHPRFEEVLEEVLRRPIGRVLVNTNGLLLAKRPSLVESIAKHRDRVELYFSFSSFRKEVHERLYGRDLRTEKGEALSIAHRAGILTTITMTAERGVNDDEIGEMLRFALRSPGVNGLTIQPVMTAGRFEHPHNPAERLTLTDTLRAMEEQSQGMLLSSDFVGLPCSHPDCCAITYGFLNAERSVLTPLPRHLDVARYMELFADRISFAGLLGAAARRVWSDAAHLRGRQTLQDLLRLFRQAGVRDAFAIRNRPEEVSRRIFRVVVKPFMDAHTWDKKRVEQCCTKMLLEDGRSVSFCEYNVLHRLRPARTAQIALTPRREEMPA